MKMVKSRVNKENGYSLHLANAQTWRIIAAEGAKSWVEKLAWIMELKTFSTNRSPKLIFIQRESNKQGPQNPICRLAPNVLEGLPRRGWKLHNLRALKVWSRCDLPDVICELGPQKNHDLDILRMLLSIFPIYKRAQGSGGLPLHAALVERNGIGILLAAPGSTGKSTCCRRFPAPWQALCDDETLIVRDNQKQYLAHPFPTWSEHLGYYSKRTWNVQRYLPLSAIFFLEQAEAEEVKPIGQGQASLRINSLASQVGQKGWKNLTHEEERAIKKNLFDNSCELAKTIPAFILRVSLSGQFWKEIEKVL